MGNDITIMSSIIIFFFTLGAALPFINAAFDVSGGSDKNQQQIVDNIGDEMLNSTETALYENFVPTGGISIFKVIKSIFLIFFWTFGSIPFWLDVSVFMVMRIVLAMIIARNIWIGGGG